jgi:hypothetical protein
MVGIKTPEQIAEATGAIGKMIERKDYFAIRTALSPQARKVNNATGAMR